MGKKKQTVHLQLLLILPGNPFVWSYLSFELIFLFRHTLFSSGAVGVGSAGTGAGSAVGGALTGLLPSVWSSVVFVSVCVSSSVSGFSSTIAASTSFSASGSGSGLTAATSSSSPGTVGSELEGTRTWELLHYPTMYMNCRRKWEWFKMCFLITLLLNNVHTLREKCLSWTLILTKLQGRRREQTPQQWRQGREPSPRSPPPHPQTLRSHKQKHVYKSH